MVEVRTDPLCPQMFWAARVIQCYRTVGPSYHFSKWMTYLTLNGPENHVNGRKSGIVGCKSHVNQEFLVSEGQHPTLNTSLSFVHTARRSYQLRARIRTGEIGFVLIKPVQISPLVGRRSRNKVSVGEPTDGSIPEEIFSYTISHTHTFFDI